MHDLCSIFHLLLNGPDFRLKTIAVFECLDTGLAYPLRVQFSDLSVHLGLVKQKTVLVLILALEGHILGEEFILVLLRVGIHLRVFDVGL